MIIVLTRIVAKQNITYMSSSLISTNIPYDSEKERFLYIFQIYHVGNKRIKDTLLFRSHELEDNFTSAASWASEY